MVNFFKELAGYGGVSNGTSCCCNGSATPPTHTHTHMSLCTSCYAGTLHTYPSILSHQLFHPLACVIFASLQSIKSTSLKASSLQPRPPLLLQIMGVQKLFLSSPLCSSRMFPLESTMKPEVSILSLWYV